MAPVSEAEISKIELANGIDDGEDGEETTCQIAASPNYQRIDTQEAASASALVAHQSPTQKKVEWFANIEKVRHDTIAK